VQFWLMSYKNSRVLRHSTEASWAKIRITIGTSWRNMQSVHLHVAGNGVIWVISKCKSCGEVAKHLAADAIIGPIVCMQCGRQMDMKGATIEAVEGARESRMHAPPSNRD